MAEVAKVQPVSYSSLTPPQSDTINGLLAGANIAAGDACYIAATGLVHPASGAAADNTVSVVAGFAFTDASTGDPVTLVTAGNFRWASALTPGARLFLSGAVAGGLADTASTGGTVPVAQAIDATRIRILSAGIGV